MKKDIKSFDKWNKIKKDIDKKQHILGFMM